MLSGMDAYIVHLLSDILEAEGPALSPPNFFYLENTEDDTEDPERWPENDPVYTFGYYCGLSREQFPPADRLNSLQMEKLCAAFTRMMFSWNLDTDIPDDVPLAKKYQLLVSTLDIKTDICNRDLTTFDLCSDDPPSCPMGEYCSCKKFLHDDTSLEENTDGVL
jgi:hypothetical protein